ncbi:MAG: hypothetical protein VX681_00295 [Myxococcota bacterium]|nr:hypothetical protein [Myxococcota bacterium]
MYQLASSRLGIVLATLAAVLLAQLPAGESAAQRKSKSIQSEARWVSFDAEAKTATVKIVKPGKIRDKQQRKQIKAGKQVVFDVTPEGSVLTRTTVAINGMKSEFADIKPGKRVYVYWSVDEARPHGRYARKIDVIFSREELEARYGAEDE